MNILKITAYHVDGTLHNSKYKSEDEVPDEEMCFNSWWYLHGELESQVGYDKAITTNCNSAGYSKKTVNWSEIKGNKVTKLMNDNELRNVMYINGEIPVEVEGFNKPCIGFFWTDDEHTVFWKNKQYPYWKQRGIVCFTDDIKSCEYGRKLIKEKPIIY